MSILSTFLTLFMAVVLFLVSVVVVRYVKYRRLSSLLQRHYKTFSIAFDVGANNLMGIIKEEAEKYKDAHYSIRHKFPEYQVSVGTLFTTPFISLNDADLIKQFYKCANEGYYYKEYKLGMDAELYTFLGRGLVFSQGEKWRSKRKIMSHVFNFNFIKNKLNIIQEIVNDKINQVQKTCLPDDKEISIDLSLLLQQIFGTVVIKCFFGVMKLPLIDGMELFTFFNELLTKLGERGYSAVSMLGEPFYKLGIRSIDRELKRMKDLFRAYVIALIKQKIQEINEKKNQSKKQQQECKLKQQHFSIQYEGLIDILLKENKLRQNEIGSTQQDYYTFNEFIDQFYTFVFAGTDTTSNLTTSLLYLLTKYPYIEQKVRSEIAEVTNGDMGCLGLENLKKLIYLDSVQKEALRMYSPVGSLLMRVAAKDHYIGKIPVSKGNYVSINITSMEHKLQYYKDPLVFRPQRWLEKQQTANQFAFFPFSYGSRSCIGQQLSYFQGKIAIAVILNRFSTITLDNPDFTFKYRIVYAPQQMNVSLKRAKTQSKQL